MAEPKFTPGPWQVDEDFPQDILAGDRRIAVSAFPDAEGSANAHLIAAAPDLYKALKRLDENGHTQAIWDFALRALAKAEGAS